MEYSTLELNLISAKDLKKVNLFSKMNVYAIVSLSGDPSQTQTAKTPISPGTASNPTWNFPIKFTLNKSLARQTPLTLQIKLRSHRTLFADKDIGQVHVPVNELLDRPGDGNSWQYVAYQVRKPSGKPKGAINFSYKFGQNFTAATSLSKEEPVVAYPPPAMGSSSVPYDAPYPPPPQNAPTYGYPPPPPQNAPKYGYPPPPPYGGYGYPGNGYPPQAGYGYPSVQTPAKKKKMGMGLGAGLLGGALGGLLIGDMISDSNGYDAGFDDGGNFDDGGFDF